jgi:predicted NAD-dependent protein-ADP-ribosyltransferase YbiA (DUF1768 family)
MFPAKIKFDGKTLPTSEHLYVLMKAFTSNDKKAIDRIFAEGLDVIHWDHIKADIMISVLMAKFQKHGFLELLIGTMGNELVEASPNRIWGCGVHINEVTGKLTNFSGQNLCGECMMVARELLSLGHRVDVNTIPELI